jgi:hypothetical protein
MSAVRHLLLSLSASIATTMSAAPEPVVFQAGEKQVALLELFTSEGCSSCPPAEDWLSGLKQSPGLWKDFVPLAFHVDYWDYLGWRDPWADSAFSDRQRNYAQSWRNRSVYTPGFVLSGKEWQDWSRHKRGPALSGLPAGALNVSSSDLSHWQVAFTPADRNVASYELHAASLASELSSDVKTGENRGRHLAHDFVVTALVHHPLKRVGDKALVDFVLNPFSKEQPAHLALAVWVTRQGQMTPLQATGGWLPQNPPPGNSDSKQ